jgi:hypothetical protein
MQRRHFKAIADALNAVRPVADNSEQYRMWQRTVARFTSMCARQNPRFQSDKFRTACGCYDKE